MLTIKQYKEEYGLPTNMVLCVTDDCNLRCKYCVINKNTHYMTLDIAKQSVDFLINNTERKEEIEGKIISPSLNFFGGEPMLCWDDIIIPLIKYIEEKYPNKIEMGITTNGTLLNQERIEFMREHHITPLLSMDGDRYT